MNISDGASRSEQSTMRCMSAPTGEVTIRELGKPIGTDALDQLSNVLIDCVDGGASVSFMQPMTRDKADHFWRGVAAGVKANERIVLAACDATNTIVGTVQIILHQPENQPHRADVAKMLVSRNARRRGIAEALMNAIELVALREGKTLLVLDTVSGSDADRLYTRLGWTRCGMIPDYALLPIGGPTATTIFYKKLEAHA